jgi:cellulose synthase/poly-beta-1,6-N-acetylglucosamine synthase-like glycosyltransferase
MSFLNHEAMSETQNNSIQVFDFSLAREGESMHLENQTPSQRSVAGVSVVTTCYNERENIQKLIPDIRQVLAGISHEIIVVDDSSSDCTIDVARQLADVAVSKKREGRTCGVTKGMPFMLSDSYRSRVQT